MLGKVLRGKRDKVFLTSKVSAGPDAKRDEIMQALEGSLRRLQTDHVDVYFNHAVNEMARLKNPEWYEFVDAAKRQGKIRFAGMSGHGPPDRLPRLRDRDRQVRRYPVRLQLRPGPAFLPAILGGLDFVARQPDLPRVIDKAKNRGVGVVVMKTLMGARLNDMRPYERDGATFSQAAFRWVLSNRNVDALIVSMTSRDSIDGVLGCLGIARRARG